MDPRRRDPRRAWGYRDDADANAQLFTDDGWTRMGDFASIDGDGYLTVVGRPSDVIIRGGKNLSAAVVEEHVRSPPAIALCTVAIPDDTFGERVCLRRVGCRPDARRHPRTPRRAA